MIKDLCANPIDTGSIPASARCPAGGNATHSRILAWEIPWTAELSTLQSTGLQESDTTERLNNNNKAIFHKKPMIVRTKEKKKPSRPSIEFGNLYSYLYNLDIKSCGTEQNCSAIKNKALNLPTWYPCSKVSSCQITCL